MHSNDGEIGILTWSLMLSNTSLLTIIGLKLFVIILFKLFDLPSSTWFKTLKKLQQCHISLFLTNSEMSTVKPTDDGNECHVSICTELTIYLLPCSTVCSILWVLKIRYGCQLSIDYLKWSINEIIETNKRERFKGKNESIYTGRSEEVYGQSRETL